MEIEFKKKKCKCCFPYECGHINLKMTRMDYELLMFVLSKSELIKKGS